MSAPPPDSGYETWEAYFRDRARPDDEPAAGAEPEAVQEVLEVALVDEPLLTGTAAAVLATAQGLGWETEVRRSRVAVPAVLYAGDGEGYSKGDVRTPATVETWWGISALERRHRIGFNTAWLESASTKVVNTPPAPPEKMPRRPKGYGSRFKVHGPKHRAVAPTTKLTLKVASCLDPVGTPVELYANYEPSASSLKPLANADRERRHAAALRQDTEYNDGADYINRRPLFTSVTQFEAWLGDWVDILTPKEAAA